MPKRTPKAPPRLPEVKFPARRSLGKGGEKPGEEPSPAFATEGEEKFEEKVIQVDRVAYVVAGGKRMRFRVLVVVGNRNGKVGVGLAKAVEIPNAVKKAVAKAKKSIIEVPLKNGTIPHEVKIKYGSAIVLLKPALPGCGVIAGGAVRAVVELAGIKDILSKILKSENKINNVMATYEALKKLKIKK